MRLINSNYMHLLFVAILFLTFNLVVIADDKELDDEKLNIISVEADIETGTLFISGNNLLGKSNDDDKENEIYKKIVLGNSELSIISWTDSLIKAYLPPGIVAGEWQAITD